MIPFNPEPCLLGVTLDRQLIFGAHTKKVCEAASSKMSMLAALSNTTWGWGKHDLLKVYNTSMKSRFNYAGAAWQPWLSSSNRDTIERSQNRALRIVTGQVTKIDCGVLRREAGIPSFKTTLSETASDLMKKKHACPTTTLENLPSPMLNHLKTTVPAGPPAPRQSEESATCRRA